MFAMDFSWKYVFKVASIMCDVIMSDYGICGVLYMSDMHW